MSEISQHFKFLSPHGPIKSVSITQELLTDCELMTPYDAIELGRHCSVNGLFVATVEPELIMFYKSQSPKRNLSLVEPICKK